MRLGRAALSAPARSSGSSGSSEVRARSSFGVPRSAATLHAQFAIPDDPNLDTFSSGVAEVAAYFRSRQWFSAKKGEASPPTHQFLTDVGGDVVGYAAVSFRNCDHPYDGAPSKAKYLMIYVTGVDQKRHGPGTRVRRASPSLRPPSACSMASAKDGCVGLCLWVRADNDRAIAFYRKVGFVDDPGGPVQRHAGAPHLTMRKLFASG